MENYLRETSDQVSFNIALSYLSGAAHEGWIVYQISEGRKTGTWSSLREVHTPRFDTLNKTKIARDKLAKWRQVKDVSSFNDDSLCILLDIPNISTNEKIDRYSRSLKPHISKYLCTNEYVSL